MIAGEMISIAEALQLIRENTGSPSEVLVDLPESLGHKLTRDIHSDIDSPPHDKSLVDGYTVQSNDLLHGTRIFEVQEEITAGEVPTKRVEAGQTSRIMTGAPMPAGADCVVMIEQSDLSSDGDQVQLSLDSPLLAGTNVMPRGKSMQSGEMVLEAGHTVRPIEIALLAEVGCNQVPVIKRPTVAVMSTGDELVEPGQTPAAGQIRNSNSYMLAALAKRSGAIPSNLGIGRDNQKDLARLVDEGLKHDVLLLSGGVSAGVLDLVPSVLEAAGVQKVFHKVHLKPGKPVWFGVGPNGQLVFGLPGNPVSSLVCFHLFVRAAMRQLLGVEDLSHMTHKLVAAHVHRGDRPTYFPAKFAAVGVSLVDWKGSADMRSLTEANCLVYFPPGDHEVAAGTDVDVYWL